MARVVPSEPDTSTTRASPMSSASCVSASEGSSEPELGLLSQVSLRFISQATEELYMDSMVQRRSTFLARGTCAYLIITFPLYALLAIDMWSSSSALHLSSSLAMTIWIVAALTLLRAILWRQSNWAAPIAHFTFASGLLQLSVPIIVGLACTSNEDRICSPTATRYVASSQAVLFCLHGLSGAVLTIPFRWVALNTATSSVTYTVVVGHLIDSEEKVEPIAFVSSTLLVTALLIMIHRQQELTDRMLFYKSIETVSQTPMGALSSLRRTYRDVSSREKRSSPQAVGSDRTVHVSTDVEEALHQLQQLQTRSGRRPSNLTKRLGRTVRLLESSVLTSMRPNVAHFDWNHEIHATGVDTAVGEWLRSTLQSQNARGESLSTIASDKTWRSGTCTAPIITSVSPDVHRQPNRLVDINVPIQLEDRLSSLAKIAKPMVLEAMRDWGYDLIQLNDVTDGHALFFVAMGLLEKYDLIQAMQIDVSSLTRFLLHVERTYGSNPYHNSIHGADVMLYTFLFIELFGFASRLSKEQLFAALLGALVHDFNHPGTTNAHEVKTSSPLALTYSDQSVLERHHLASSFAIMRTKGFDILAGLSSESHHAIRSIIIEVVLATDLTGHFDFIGRLKTLSATRGRRVLDEAIANDATRLIPAAEVRGEARRHHSIDIRLSVLARRASLDSKGAAVIEGAGRKASISGRRGSSSGMFYAVKQQPWRSPFFDENVDPRFLLTTAVKFADLNHASKPWTQHQQWSHRITEEFWSLGDKERVLGVHLSPLCDRDVDKNIAKSQIGFFQFVCNPFFELVADLVDPKMKPYMQLQLNFQAWKVKENEGK